MRKILLTKGYAAFVDEGDFERVSKVKWCACNRRGKIYAVRRPVGQQGGNLIAMHRALMQVAPGLVVDHVNGDSLDNRRSNLRVCTRRENQRNRRGATRVSLSGVRGVIWDKARGKFAARIGIGEKTVFLGRFASIDAAATAYRAANVQFFGVYGGVAS